MLRKNAIGALVCATATLTLAGCHGHDDDMTLPWGRLLVADATEAKVRLIDIDDAEVIATYDVDAPARVFAGPGNRHGFVVQNGVNSTRLVDGGMWMVWHDNHYDRFKEAHGMLSRQLETPSPGAVVATSGWLTIFNEGDGTVTAVSQQHLHNDGMTPRTVATARAHEGVALVLKDHILASRPDMSDLEATRGFGVTVYNPNGQQIVPFEDCPQLQGAAAGDEAAAFGCSDGVLFVRHVSGGFTAEKKALPSDAPAGSRVTTLQQHDGASVFLGDLGDDGLALVNPTTGAVTRIALSGSHVAFAWNADGSRAVVVLSDGSLQIVDVTNGATVDSAQNVVATHTGGTRPALAVDARAIYVTDPTRGRIVEVLLQGLKVNESFTVGGTPSGLALLGHP